MAIRKDLERKHLRLQQCESINRKLAAHIGKYNGIFARLCVVFHCVDHAGDANLPEVVTADTARCAAGFLHGFLLPHALAFYAGVLGLSNDHDVLSDVASYILARRLDKITNRDVQRGSRGMRSLKQREVEGLFEQLDAFGWLTRVPGPRLSDPHHWVVNPAVHQKFAERAEAETEAPRGGTARRWRSCLGAEMRDSAVSGCSKCHHLSLVRVRYKTLFAPFGSQIIPSHTPRARKGQW